MQVVFEYVKLQSLMAWYNTLGGAHSSLGDVSVIHVSAVWTWRHMCTVKLCHVTMHILYEVLNVGPLLLYYAHVHFTLINMFKLYRNSLFFG